MKKILEVREPNVYARFVGAQELHPLISVIHYDALGKVHGSLNNYGVYGLFIQREFPQNLSYGVKSLQAGDTSVIAVAPGQLGGVEDNGQTLEPASGCITVNRPIKRRRNRMFSSALTHC